MLKLRKILLCDFLYIIFIIVILFFSLFRLLFFKSSNYSLKSNLVEGIVTKIVYKENNQVIYLKNKENFIINFKVGNKLKFTLGDRILVKGEFKRASKNTTEYLFNYQKYLERKNIFYIVDAKEIEIVKKNKNIYYLIKQALYNNFQNNPYLLTFIMGDKSLMKNNVLRSYQENGISHLFAISGMHITMFANILNIILKKLSLNEEKKFLIISFFLCCYLLLVGFSPSILRGVLFYIFFTLNKIYYFYIKPVNLYIFILGVCLLINPNFIFDVGFWYSFLISLALILYSFKLQSKNFVISLFKVSFLSFIVSIPISLFNFYQINILSIFYNILFVPLISFIIFPCALISSLVKPIRPIFNFFIIILENLSLFLNKISFGKLIFKRLNMIVYIIYLVIIILFLFWKRKLLLKLFFILLIFHFMIPLFSNNTYIKMLDIGQGDSILLHFNKKSILIDTGGVYSYKNNEADGKIFYNIILPAFKSLGIGKLDYLIITHGDADHMGEAIQLIENFKVEVVIFNCGEYNNLEKKLIKVLEKKKIKYYSCIKELNIDKNKLYFLQTKEYNNENDNSNVIYTEIEGYRFLFMGDAGVLKEKDILDTYDISKIDVLKVGHHGSRTSTSELFLKKINPQIALISAGRDNKFNHPHDEVLKLLNKYKIKVFSTKEFGSITIDLNKFKIRKNK
ncbi:MAG: DNA internalization-related competence protein ComEC/Rec2 [Bacilli bacterium]|nr:DNA internalization-related competence protein ComEC/Rec2 [Bacilli bacterium]